MKHLLLFCLTLCLSFSFISCSDSGDNGNPVEEPDTDQDVDTTPENLVLKSSAKLYETPFESAAASIVVNDTLMVITSKGLYQYSFISKEWQLVNENVSIGHAPDASFINNGKWYLWVNHYPGLRMYCYDLNSKKFSTLPYITTDFSSSTGALYCNDTLFVFDFSDYANTKKKLYYYDFTLNQTVKLSDNSGLNLYNSATSYKTIKVNDEHYFIANRDIYKFDKINKQFNRVKETGYIPNYSGYSGGVILSHNNTIVWGLGGTASSSNGAIYSYSCPTMLIYYNTDNNEVGRVKNSIYEGQSGSIAFDYKGINYLMGGSTIRDMAQGWVNRKCIDQLIFE